MSIWLILSLPSRLQGLTDLYGHSLGWTDDLDDTGKFPIRFLQL